MKKVLIKILLFIMFIVFLIVINMIAFRSSFPTLWFLTLIGSVTILIVFPYNKLFKKQN